MFVNKYKTIVINLKTFVTLSFTTYLCIIITLYSFSSMKYIILIFISLACFIRTKADNPSEFVEVYETYMVDLMPQFPGGDIAMMKFINRERKYPREAYHDGIEGRVRCSFVVNEDGRISNVSVLRSVEKSLDDEAIRIISEMPHWEAGEINNQPVPVYYILSIPFRK